MLRSIRSNKDPEAGILCHFINIRHWKETSLEIVSQMAFHHHTLVARAYVELLKQPLFLSDPDRSSVLDEVFQDFSNYLDAVGEKLVSSAGAVPSLDALLVFGIGVIIAAATQGRANNAPELFKVSNALALLSSRYAAIRSLGDIMAELHECVSQGQPRNKLRELVANSEVVISEPLQKLIFGDRPDESTLSYQILR
jgi:hypothetical protein